jgi:hypothetical protein
MCVAIREALLARDRRALIAKAREREYVEREKLEHEKVELIARTFAGMARTLEAIRCLPETGEPPAHSE